jgi:phosphate transport system substrate-binding protein
METNSGRLISSLLFAAASVFLPIASQGQQILRLSGTPTAGLPVSDAARILKSERNLKFDVSTEGGSSTAGITKLGLDDADVAICSRFVTAEDRAQFPSESFTEIYFGESAAVMVVSKDVWESGVHSLSHAQAKGIYEGKIRNWKDLGGASVPITGYAPEQGRSVWACYIQWIYEDLSKMRPNRFASLSSDEESKLCLDATAGSIAEVSMTYALDNKLHCLAIKSGDGTIIESSPASVANHTYPMSRPLLLVVKGRPLSNTKILVDFMLGDRGQALVHKYNFLTLKDMGIAPQTFD